MQKTVLITGVGSGIGKATANYFKQRGWKVLGTSRSASTDAWMYTLDVTDAAATQMVIDQILRDHHQIDVVINNAGYGLFGAFEQCTEQDVMEQYQVNVFGTMHVCRAVLPHMRQRKSGTIINISSIGGKFVVPYYGVYNSTKFAIEGFSEGLWNEVKGFGIRVKVIEPGAIRTAFYTNSKKTGHQMNVDAQYKRQADALWANYTKFGAAGPGPEVIAKTLFKAANGVSNRLRYAAPLQAKALITLFKLLPHQWTLRLIRWNTLGRAK